MKHKILSIQYHNRPIIVINGIAFYQSTGTNTGEQYKGTWFPMLGMQQKTTRTDCIPIELQYQGNDRLEDEMPFVKPSMDLIEHTTKKQRINVETIHREKLNKFMEYFDELGSSFTTYKNVERFFMPELLAMSACLGGGVWNTAGGKSLKEALENEFPHYFSSTYEIEPISENAYIIENNEDLNLYILSCGGYLWNGSLETLVDRVRSRPSNTELNSAPLDTPERVLHKLSSSDKEHVIAKTRIIAAVFAKIPKEILNEIYPNVKIAYYDVLRRSEIETRPDEVFKIIVSHIPDQDKQADFINGLPQNRLYDIVQSHKTSQIIRLFMSQKECHLIDAVLSIATKMQWSKTEHYYPIQTLRSEVKQIIKDNLTETEHDHYERIYSGEKKPKTRSEKMIQDIEGVLKGSP